ncbi:trihelix transcription factor ASR3-like [Impatiens glandulifera]|uniref:trihelix transcription factor ASR3-like n=1 Tax=Impatiens glandulifera TaxID=253017 RepID=UPI001FB16A74|nr:trihelix transcription factor ASR3-like [Impatiens glandulifera]
MKTFRKVKVRESVKKEEDKSFWNMTPKERKVIKLPGFFDKEVYDVLDGNPWRASAIPLNQVATNDSSKKLPSMEKNEPVNCHEEAASKEVCKRIRLSENGNSELINVLRQSQDTLKSFVEANNVEKNNEQDNDLVTTLKKIRDALGRIAHKL